MVLGLLIVAAFTVTQASAAISDQQLVLAVSTGCTEYKSFDTCCGAGCKWQRSDEHNKQNTEVKCWDAQTTGTDICKDWITPKEAVTFAKEVKKAYDKSINTDKIAEDGKAGFDQMKDALHADQKLTAEITQVYVGLVEKETSSKQLDDRINGLKTDMDVLKKELKTIENEETQTKLDDAQSVSDLKKALNDEQAQMIAVKSGLKDSTNDITEATEVFKMVRRIVNKDQGHEDLYGEMKKKCFAFFSCSGKCSKCYDQNLLYKTVVHGLDSAGKGLVGSEQSKHKSTLGTELATEIIDQTVNSRFRSKLSGSYDGGKAAVKAAVKKLDVSNGAFEDLATKIGASRQIIDAMNSKAKAIDTEHEALHERIKLLNKDISEAKEQITSGAESLALATQKADTNTKSANAELQKATSQRIQLAKDVQSATQAYLDVWAVMTSLKASFEKSTELGTCYENGCYDALGLKDKLASHST